MGIILKHSLPHSPYILYVIFFILSFNVSFFSTFQNAPKVVQKRSRVQKMDTLKKITQNVQNMIRHND